MLGDSSWSERVQGGRKGQEHQRKIACSSTIKDVVSVVSIGIPRRGRGYKIRRLWFSRGLRCSEEGPVKLHYGWSKIYLKVRTLEEEKGSQKPTHANIRT